MLINKEHFSKEGLNTIRIIKEHMNNNRPWTERWKFINESYKDVANKVHLVDPEWLTAFVDGEGSFNFDLGHSKIRDPYYVRVAANPTLEIKQSNHDSIILDLIKNNLKSGYTKGKFNPYILLLI